MRVWSLHQKRIFDFVATGSGHGVAVARAGSGKTSTIVEAFSHVPAGRSVGMFAFNKAIAEELETRAPAGVRVMTLHKYGFGIVQRGIGWKRPTTIDRDKVAKMLTDRLESELTSRDPRVRERANEHLRAACKATSLAKANLAHDAEQIDDLIDRYDIQFDGSVDPIERSKVVRLVMWALDQSKDRLSTIDFDDMIWLPVVLNWRGAVFDFVFIDETQDLNPCQIELAMRACRATGRILAVGDDRQAIYGFRGADENAVKNVVERLGAQTMPLSVTYRCSKRVVEVARRIVPDIEASPDAREGLVQNLEYNKMLDSVQPGDFVLSRVNAALLSLCLDFVRSGRKATVVGRDIGQNLMGIIRRLEATTVPELTERVQAWANAECARLEAKKPPADPSMVLDKAACIDTLAEGAKTVNEVLDRCASFFSDETNGGRILLSSTHKAKGLERERVFLLEWTYHRGRSIEEDNLFYVAVTRAKHALYFVAQRKKEREQPEPPAAVTKSGVRIGKPVAVPAVLKELPKKPPRKKKAAQA